jgi:GH25 family lysozyme M1 (1,4-beta-N-acetylmuramidase)
MIRGFDASTLQGDPPWDDLKKQGIRYVYLRCGVGNDYKDPDFDRLTMEAKAHGVVVAPYHFLYPLPHIDPVDLANQHFKWTGGVGTNEGELPAAIDLEWPPREELAKDGKTIVDTWAKWGCSRLQINQWAAAYAAEYHRLAGCHCVLYTYPYFAQCLAPLDTSFGDMILWWASNWKTGQVPKDGDKPVNVVPGLWQKDMLQGAGSRGFFWQHDGNGGILMPNGRDADFDVFVGTEEQFNELCGIHSDPTPAPVPIPTLETPETGGSGSGS